MGHPPALLRRLFQNGPPPGSDRYGRICGPRPEGRPVSLADSTKRKVFARLSIAVGNTVQAAGIVAAYFALTVSRLAHTHAVAVATMILAWVLLYFCSHAIAHWLVGRLVGIRFLF